MCRPRSIEASAAELASGRAPWKSEISRPASLIRVPRCCRCKVVNRRPTCSRNQSSGGSFGGQVGVEVAGDVEERVLDDIRGVEPGAEPSVQPQLHHAPEPLAMQFEQRGQRLAVAAAELLDQVVRVAGRLVHECPHC